MTAPCISVIGGSRAPAELLRQAEVVGAEIAKSGATLVTGGLGGRYGSGE